MPVIGIDLGTTNTAIAVLEDGKPRVLADDRGHKVLPSCVSAKGGGRFVVGHAAQSMILTRPERTVYATKRLIGRRFDSPEVAEARRRMHYGIREAPDGGVEVQLGEEWLSPVQVAAVVLQVAKSIAEKALKAPVEEAVITVPAYFNHTQRQATLEAAARAGLRCERLLNEPTAAALAYGHRRTVDRTILVFDLGGGTFDVSVLRLSNSVYEMLATLGDTFLGGEDFDFLLVDHLAEQFQRRVGLDPRTDRGALQRLKDAAEKAKCELSFADRATITLPQLLQGHSLETTLTRRTLEEISQPLLDRVMEVTRRAVSDAQLQPSDVHDVILVGGQTRMPRLREMVTSYFGRDPSRSVHPEEAVAVGASVHAASLDDPESPAAVLLDVTPFDIGIDAAGGVFSGIIKRNSRVPAAESKTFATVHDDQTSVRVTVRQGESRFAAENEFLGEFVMDGLTPAPRFQTKVDVGFRLDTNGILHVSAVERGTGERKQISIRNYAEHARAPKMPTEADAEAERLLRANGAGGAAAAATPGAKVAKVGLLDSLFGRFSRKSAAPAATNGAASAAVATSAAAAASAAASAAPAGATAAGATPAAASAPDASPAQGSAAAQAAGLPNGATPPADPGPGVAAPAVTPPPTTLASPSGTPPAPQISRPPRISLGGSDLTFEAPEDDDPEMLTPVDAGPSGLDADALFGDDGGGDQDIVGESGDFGDATDHGGPRSLADDPLGFGALDEPATDSAPFPEPVPTRVAPAVVSTGGFGPPVEDSSLDGNDLFGGDLFGGGPVETGTADAFGWGAPPAPAAPPRAPAAPPSSDTLGDPFAFLSEVAPPAAPSSQPSSQSPSSPSSQSPSSPSSQRPSSPPPAPSMGLDIDFAALGFSAEDLDAADGFGLAAPPARPAPTRPPAPAPPAPTPPAPTPPAPTPSARPSVAPPSLVVPPPALLAPELPSASAPSPAASASSAPASSGPASSAPSGASRWGTDDYEFPLGEEGARQPEKAARKPARVKLQYKSLGPVVTEYLENLRQGGAFIRTEKPLEPGRQCVFEVRAPGLSEPLQLAAVVVASRPTDPVGMRVEYRLSGDERQHAERRLLGARA